MSKKKIKTGVPCADMDEMEWDKKCDSPTKRCAFPFCCRHDVYGEPFQNHHVIILYHGTTKDNADNILRSGLKEYSYLAKHLEDALGMGGPYVVEFVLRRDSWGMISETFNLERYNHPDCFQLRNRSMIPPWFIRKVTFFEPRIIFKNGKKDLNKIVEGELFDLKNQAGIVQTAKIVRDGKGGFKLTLP